MSADEDKLYPVPARLLDPAQCPEPYIKSVEQYREMYRQSIENPNEFFGKVRTTSMSCSLQRGDSDA